MPTYIFLDTNSWIYLANGFDVESKGHFDLHMKIFNQIEDWTSARKLVFLVNEIILAEYERNKKNSENYVRKIENKAGAFRQTLKELKAIFPDKNDVIAELDALTIEWRNASISGQRKHILQVEAFLKDRTIQIPISVQVRLEACQFAIEKRSPFFTNNKNGMADALHLLSVVEYMDKNHKETIDIGTVAEPDLLDHFPESWFVSGNFKEFSDPESRERPHPDLSPILNRCCLNFHHNVIPFLKSMDENLLSDEETALVNDFIGCSVCLDKRAEVFFRDVFEIVDPNLPTSPREPLRQTYVDVKFGECNHCPAKFIQCPNCNELVHVEVKNRKFNCSGCNYCFIFLEERDRKGAIYSIGLEIVREYRCHRCGEMVESVNREGICEVCVEYDRIANDS